MMHTGPVSANLPDLNHSIRADSRDTFSWATVVTPDPLSIVFDGQTAPVPGTPASCVPPSALLPDTRVWVQRHSPDDGHSAARRNILVGLAGGGNPWVTVTLLDGYAKRPDTAGGQDFHPMVKLDGSGLVDFKGQMNNDGFPSSGNVATNEDVPIMQLPDGYWPAAEQRFIGYPTDNPAAIIGGYVNHADGKLYVKGTSKSPTTHWCIIVAPWEPVPAQPY